MECYVKTLDPREGATRAICYLDKIVLVTFELSNVMGGASFFMVLKIFNETRQVAIGTALLGVVSTLLGMLLIFGSLILWVMGKRLSHLENRIANRHNKDSNS